MIKSIRCETYSPPRITGTEKRNANKATMENPEKLIPLGKSRVDRSVTLQWNG
jgi:hypothetical protein